MSIMNANKVGLVAFLILIIGQAQAQGLYLQDVSAILQNTYRHENDQKILSAEKTSLFDTSKILTAQETKFFRQVDGQAVLNRKTVLAYNPQTKMGTYTTEEYQRNTAMLSEFKSYDHEEKRLWVKQYQMPKKELKSETRYEYNKQGHMTRSESRDRELDVVKIDEIQRNPKGLMTRWEAYDESPERGRQKVREMNYRYLADDSTLLNSSGYVYNRWTEIENRYDKRGQLTQSTSYAGIYAGTRIRRDEDKVVSSYKNGQIIKIDRFELGKKVATHTFKYAPGFKEETIARGKEKTVITTKEVYMDDFLAKRQILRNGKMESDWTYTRVGNQLAEKIEIEYKSGGDRWETRLTYNEKGNLTLRTFAINGQIRQTDEYRYTYHPKAETTQEAEDGTESAPNQD